jgi:hypothetical protein
LVCFNVNEKLGFVVNNSFRFRCLTTIAKHDGASEHLCYSNNLLEIIKQIQEKWSDRKDIQDEAKFLWHMINKSSKPKPPIIDGRKNNSLRIYDSFSF